MGDLTWCKGSTQSAYGQVSAHWWIADGTFHLDVTIPEGGFADVYLPHSDYAQSVGEGRHLFEEPAY